MLGRVGGDRWRRRRRGGRHRGCGGTRPKRLPAMVAEAAASGIGVSAAGATQLERGTACIAEIRLRQVLMLASGALHATASGQGVDRTVSVRRGWPFHTAR